MIRILFILVVATAAVVGVIVAGSEADSDLHGQGVLVPREALADALTASGADCELQVWKGQMHVFQILNRVLPEASAAMRDAARFIGSVTAPAPKESEVAA